MIEKTKTYKLLERFHNEAILTLKDALAKPDVKKKGVLEDRLAFYIELYNTMFRLTWSHSDFVYHIRKYHEEMVKLGVYKVDDDGNSHCDLDVIEDEFHESYKRVERLYNYYQEYQEGLIPVNETLDAIKLFQKLCETVVIDS